MNRGRGLLRLYAVLTVAWMGWELYSTVADFRKAREKLTHDETSRDCAAEADTQRHDPKLLRQIQELRDGGASDEALDASRGLEDLALEIQQDCRTVVDVAKKMAAVGEQETIFRTVALAYRTRGYPKLIWYCLGPPLALLLLGFSLTWVARGFGF